MHLMRHVTNISNRLEFYGWPLLQLCMRFWMAHVFWRAGRIKLKHWDATLSLFKFEYKVPYIAPDHAAYLATSMELLCPILLVVGFMTRLATIPLLLMTLIIHLTYMSSNEHIYWMFLLTTLLFKGAGLVSLDSFICRPN
jgi:putative oxidoreductase